MTDRPMRGSNSGPGGKFVFGISDDMEAFDNLTPHERFVIATCCLKISAIDYKQEMASDPSTLSMLERFSFYPMADTTRAARQQRQLDRTAIVLMRRIGRSRRA